MKAVEDENWDYSQLYNYVIATSIYIFLDTLILQLKSLGDLCGLMSEKGPTSEDLNRTVDLLAGLGDERPETGGFSAQTFPSDDTLGLAFDILNNFSHYKLSYFTVNSLQSPYKKLKEALSSVEAFERHYLAS